MKGKVRELHVDGWIERLTLAQAFVLVLTSALILISGYTAPHHPLAALSITLGAWIVIATLSQDGSSPALQKPTQVERYLVVFIMYLGSTARIPLISSANNSETGLMLDLFRAGGYLLSAGLIVAFYQNCINGVFHAKAVVLLVALSVTSVMWSITPAASLRQGMVLIGMTALGIYIGSRFDSDDILYMLTATTAVIALMSILVVTLLPRFGGIQPDGAWRGVFLDKNQFGEAMALGALCCAIFLLSQPRGRPFIAGLFCVCTALLVLSNSITSVVVLVLVLAAIPLLRFASEGSIRAFSVLFALAIIVPALIVNFDRSLGPLLQSMGRDPSLTGRTKVWSLVIDAISARPFLGYGHSAYWANPDVARQMVRELDWLPAFAHNGYLDLLLSVGVIGLSLFVVSLVRSVNLALSHLRQHGGQLSSSFPAALLLFFLLYNSSESVTGVQAGILWIVYVAVHVSLAVSDRRYANPPDMQQGILERSNSGTSLHQTGPVTKGDIGRSGETGNVLLRFALHPSAAHNASFGMLIHNTAGREGQCMELRSW